MRFQPLFSSRSVHEGWSLLQGYSGRYWRRGNWKIVNLIGYLAFGTVSVNPAAPPAAYTTKSLTVEVL